MAIDPASRAFGFAVLEGPEKLVDWGVRSAKKDKHTRCLRFVEELIDRYRPNVVVVEDYNGKNSRRCERAEKLIEDIRELAAEKKVRVRSYSPKK